MSDTVSRSKYESIKRKATAWKETAMDAESELRRLQAEITDTPRVDPALIEQLTKERDELSRENDALQRKIAEEIFKKEREYLLKEGEIDRLKMALGDYKDRYQEIRDDNRELRRCKGSV